MKRKRPGFVLLWIGLFLVLLVPATLFADAAHSLNPVDVSARLEKLESRVVELQSQLLGQNKKHSEEIAQLKHQIEIKAPQEGTTYLPGPEAKTPKWLEGLSMGGDLRLRYDAFETNEATRDRNRFRYRLRWEIAKEISKDVELGFRFVSGSSTDPTSTNQTLTGDFTYKSIFIDQAYIKYRSSFLTERISGLKKAEFGGGKVENPFQSASSGLVWDGDVMPEGVYESLEFSLADEKIKPFITLGQFLLQENVTVRDAELYGFQSGVRWNPLSKESGVQLTHAFAYYDFSDYARDSNFLVSGTSLARGNTRTGSAAFLEAGDFDILQIYNEIKFKIKNMPVKLFGDFAKNLADQTRDPLDRETAYEYGIRLGEAKKKGDWEATYYYAYIEPNSVVGAFNESDFGIGGADKRGSAFQLKYKLTDSLKLGVGASFVNNVIGTDDETRRFTSDLEWVF